MSTVLEPSLHRADRVPQGAWLAVVAGLALLYVPTYLDLARGLWSDDAHAHGPLILAVVAWLFWKDRAFLVGLHPAPVAGGVSLGLGLLLYLLGRTQSLMLFEVASHLPVVAGLVLLAGGWAALRRLAFPVLFLAFVVPLPGFVLDIVTQPLKGIVSVAVEHLVRFLGYPVERSGVVLTVGNHEMLVADACSGLNSLMSLSALSLLYLRLTGPRSPSRTALLLAAIVPIAIVANVLRVLGLVLVTVHFGPEAAQGAFHGIAGMMVFVVALGLLLAMDRRSGTLPAARESAPSAEPAVLPRLALLLAGMAMATTAAAAPLMKPVPDGRATDLETLVPAQFGEWKLDLAEAAVGTAPDVKANLDRLYGQVLNRTYVNAAGEQMLLTVAYGGDQSDALKAHRQEVCYSAQGFSIHGLAHGRLQASGRDLPATRFHAVRGDRSEPVTYWFTMGDRVVLGRGERLREQLRNGLAGRVPDGMLVRVSSLTTDVPAAYAAQQSFVAAMLAPMAAGDAVRLAGAP